ncbi:MAG: NAD(P)H-dependent oxidoreductase [Gemmatimonadaceae bacterium]|nr:NAD(P)H-dependent oxidoreductase [Gemmatimonadaceae bacterium]
MEKGRDVAVLVGSLRKESITRKVVLAMKGIAPPSLALDIVEIRDLPMYDQDLETETPPGEWVAFRERIKRADALLFATPEYNRSVPGCLKNAVDVGSRSGGHGVFSGKPGAIVSVTPYGLGAFGANHHLRQALVYVNVLTMAQPEAYVSQAGDLVDADYKITREASRQFLTTFLEAFAAWIEQTRKEP